MRNTSESKVLRYKSMPRTPEMKNIVEKYNCGFVSNSFAIREIASLINRLSPEEIMEKKRASLEA